MRWLSPLYAGLQSRCHQAGGEGYANNGITVKEYYNARTYQRGHFAYIQLMDEAACRLPVQKKMKRNVIRECMATPCAPFLLFKIRNLKHSGLRQKLYISIRKVFLMNRKM